MPPSQSQRKRRGPSSVAAQAAQNGLEIDADPRFQARDWVAQRIGWALIAVLVVAAALGVFGDGALSHSRVEAGDAFWVEYQRFARKGAPTTIVVHVERGGGPIRVRIEQSVFEALRLDSITPSPLRVEAQQEWVTYHFAGRAPADVRFHLEPQRAGWSGGRWQIPGGGSGVALAQLVYP